MGPEIKTFLGPEMATRVPIWAQKIITYLAMKTTGTLIVEMTQRDKSKPGQGPREVQTFFRCSEEEKILIYFLLLMRNSVGFIMLAAYI